MKKDIVGAMAKEREYLSFRRRGEEPYHFVDAVKKYGFESLKEFFEAKRDYLFVDNNSFEIFEATPVNFLDEIRNAFSENKNKVGFMDIEKTLVFEGNSDDANKEYCEECNIPIYPYQALGGSIVATSGDVVFGIFYKGTGKDEERYILERIKSIFEKYSGKTFRVDGNDILADGTKILGSTIYKQDDISCVAGALSFSDKSNLIANVCLKHSTKQPGYIDFMDRETFKREVKKWLTVK